MAERWRLEGIPAPSGSFEVGCTHLMHQDLHLRLYYPTDKELATKIEYANYLPHPNYLTAFLDNVGVPLSSLLPEVQQLLSCKLCLKSFESQFISTISNWMMLYLNV